MCGLYSVIWGGQLDAVGKGSSALALCEDDRPLLLRPDIVEDVVLMNPRKQLKHERFAEYIGPGYR
jgi:hypothetical protein